ncbi:DUF2634 domain-containing protein (plasmid) [Apilactobacillus apisilvae]|uniref:DUF2634 domain-containing protein n=1 Tax=Apilactobacillus apisilvae TaxID=2923364 RepID=A0ABY4PJ19_9LACO|nr:DUF2634 domain-containing protein [Apilactobacillus apisilvae]UQS85871.1 DUF2634 domain-containing protein [Apilactobacillus apisilvae]
MADEDLQDDADDEVLDNDMEEVTLPSKTFAVENGRVIRLIDGREAMQQAINKVLTTERFVFPIYDENYGSDAMDLIGKDADYIHTDIERVIEEALTADDRISSVTIDEVIDMTDSILVTGSAETIFGKIDIEGEVKSD